LKEEELLFWTYDGKDKVEFYYFTDEDFEDKEFSDKDFLLLLEPELSSSLETILHDIGVKPREIKRIIPIGEKRDQGITLTDAERVYLHRFREKYGPAWRKFKSEGNLSSSLFP